MSVPIDVWTISSPRPEMAARRVLPRILRTYLDAEPEIIRSPGSKPRLAGGSILRFSVAHTTGLALIAVSRGGEVGIDVEHMDPTRVDLAVATRFLGQRLAQDLAVMPPPLRTRPFLAAWTELEAAAKGTGRGIDGLTGADRCGVVVGLALGPDHVGALWTEASGTPRLSWHRMPGDGVLSGNPFTTRVFGASPRAP